MGCVDHQVVGGLDTATTTLQSMRDGIRGGGGGPVRFEDVVAITNDNANDDVINKHAMPMMTYATSMPCQRKSKRVRGAYIGIHI